MAIQPDERREARSARRLILLLSSERSGSTLLRVMLGEHSRIVAPPELFLMRYPDYDTWRARKPVAVESLVELFRTLGAPQAVADIDAACRGRRSVDVYRWLLDALPDGGMLIDKTPAYANGRQTLRRSLALDPYYVWLIRHPLGVIDSHLSRKVPARRWTAVLQRIRDHLGTMAGLAETDATLRFWLRETKWMLQQTNILDFLVAVPESRKSVLYFEDLVSSPRAVLEPLCERLGIEIEPSVLEPGLRGRRQNPELGDANLHTHDRLEQAKASSWQKRFSEDQLKPETRSLMHEIGVRSVASR